MKKRFISQVITVCVILAAVPSSAHSRKTDAYGGHYDNETGEYHYHHGYPAHKHIDGVCPYDFDDQTDHSSGTSYSAATPKPELHLETPDPLSPEIKDVTGESSVSSDEVISPTSPPAETPAPVTNDSGKRTLPYVSVFCAFGVAILLYVIHKKSIKTAAPKSDPEQSTKENEQTPQEIACQNTALLSPPDGIGIGTDSLPFKLNRRYAWGREFNAFITQNGHCYHRSSCKALKGKGKYKKVIHRYEALKRGYDPCHYCTPKNYVDDWYKKMFPNSPYADIPKKNFEQLSITEDYEEIFFTRTCSHCGHTFKVKYKKPADKKKIPPLSVVCPKCKEKQTFKI